MNTTCVKKIDWQNLICEKIKCEKLKGTQILTTQLTSNIKLKQTSRKTRGKPQCALARLNN
jgi:hypothetical protein